MNLSALSPMRLRTAASIFAMTSAVGSQLGGAAIGAALEAAMTAAMTAISKTAQFIFLLWVILSYCNLFQAFSFLEVFEIWNNSTAFI